MIAPATLPLPRIDLDRLETEAYGPAGARRVSGAARASNPQGVALAGAGEVREPGGRHMVAWDPEYVALRAWNLGGGSYGDVLVTPPNRREIANA